MNWLAPDKDGVGHAYRREGLGWRAACGLPSVDARFAYPMKSRHDVCQRTLDAERGRRPPEAVSMSFGEATATARAPVRVPIEQEITVAEDTFITISKGGPPPEEDVEDGTWPLVLVEIKQKPDVKTEYHPEGQDMLEWVFAVDDEAGNRMISGLTTKATGPKSKAFAWIAALTGKMPELKAQFKLSELIGRRAYGAIIHNDAGYPRINGLTAIPRAAGITMPGKPTEPVVPVAPIGPAAQTPAMVPIGQRATEAATQAAFADASAPKDDELGF